MFSSTLTSGLKFTRLSALSAFLSSVALGCVVTLGGSGKEADSCTDDNSFLSNGECFCNAGYDWCKPNDINNLDCCATTTSDTNPGTGTSDTNNGTTTNAPTSGTTAEVPTTSETNGTTGAPLDCSVGTEPPGSCDANTENFLCLTADNPDCGPEGSKYYVCTNGSWVENPNGPNENCIADGHGFAYGCVDEDSMVKFVCGEGPGTACTNDTPDACNGDVSLESCDYGKLSATDCTVLCMTEGDGMGVTYDYGYCGDQRGISCICCDEGDADCPINMGGTTGGGTTGGGTTGG